MQKLDRSLQQRVWSRVYGNSPAILRGKQRENARNALRCAGKNLAFYEKMEHHAVYGEAFARLSRETREQIKMLRQILAE